MFHSKTELRNSSVKITMPSTQLLPFPLLLKTSVVVGSDLPNSRWMNFVVTSRKRSLRRLCLHRCLSVHRGISVSVGGGAPSGALCSGGSPSGGSLSRGSLSRGSLSRGVSVQGFSVQDTPRQIPPPYSNEWVVGILLECSRSFLKLKAILSWHFCQLLLSLYFHC